MSVDRGGSRRDQYDRAGTGVLDRAGNLNPAFFERPLRTVGRMLTEPARRKSLVDALPILLGDAATASSNGNERRSYPLVAGGRC